MGSFDEAMGTLCMYGDYHVAESNWRVDEVVDFEPYKIMRKYMADEEIVSLVTDLTEYFTHKSPKVRFVKAIIEILYTAENEFMYDRINPEMRDELFEYMLGEEDRLHAPMFEVCTEEKSPILFRKNIARNFLTSFGYPVYGRMDRLIKIFLSDEDGVPKVVPKTPALPSHVTIENIWEYIEENNLGKEFSPVVLARLMPTEKIKDYILKLVEGDTEIVGRRIEGVKYRWYAIMDVLYELRVELYTIVETLTEEEIARVSELSPKFMKWDGTGLDGKVCNGYHIDVNEFIMAALMDEGIKQKFIDFLNNAFSCTYYGDSGRTHSSRYSIELVRGEKFLCKGSHLRREFSAIPVRRKTRRFIPQLKNASTPLAKADLEFLTMLQEKDAKIATNFVGISKYNEVDKFSTVESYVLIGLYYTMREVVSNAGATERGLLDLAESFIMEVQELDISYPGRVEDYIRSILKQYRSEIGQYRP